MPPPRVGPSGYAATAGAVLLAPAFLWAALPRPAAAQTLAEVTATPEQAATLFLRSVRAIRWGTAAQFMAASTLDRFHQVVTLMVEADSSGYVQKFLTGTTGDAYAALSPRDVFDRSLTAMFDDMPGLMHAVYDRDDHVLGHVMEGGDTAHVVYRTTARISGAVSEVKVMQLVHTAGGWRVLWSDELDVVDAAIRGIARTRRPPPEATRS